MDCELQELSRFLNFYLAKLPNLHCSTRVPPAFQRPIPFSSEQLASIEVVLEGPIKSGKGGGLRGPLFKMGKAL